MQSSGEDEDWIIDTTGCQYGFRETLVPLEKYITETECRIVEPPRPYDAHVTMDVDATAAMFEHPAQQADLQLERRGRLLFDAFVRDEVDGDMVKGSEAVFKDRTERFQGELRAHMERFYDKN